MKLHSATYDSYKKSEGEWSKTIPSEWQEKRVKDLFRLVTQAAPANNDYELLSLFSGIGVKPRKDMEARGNKASSTDGYWIVKENDIVVNKLLAWMGSVGISEYDGVTSPAYDVLRQVKPDIDPRYYSYLFRTETAKKIFRKNSRGIMDMRLRLYFDKLGAITVPTPSFEMQKSISNYIQKEIYLIDEKIRLLTRKIELYHSLKYSVINSAVSFGLNKESKVRHSDVEFIKKIPYGWNEKRLEDVSKIIDPQPDHRAPAFAEGEGYPYIGIRDLNYDGTLNFDSARKVELSAIEKQERAFKVEHGDILFCKVGTLGEPRLVIPKGRFALSATLVLIKVNRKSSNKFINYVLESDQISQQVSLMGSGSTRPALGIKQIRKFLFACPEKDEQEK
ncbi:MAG: type I restriction enzyme S subunit, partial [Candidatus Endobugula sp.]